MSGNENKNDNKKQIIHEKMQNVIKKAVKNAQEGNGGLGAVASRQADIDDGTNNKKQINISE